MDADPASSYIATMTQENAPAGLYIQAAEHDALDMALTNAGFGIPVCADAQGRYALRRASRTYYGG